jgi:hypothetical protein
MPLRQSKVWSALAPCAALVTVALLVPLPYPPSQADRSAAVSQALDSLLKNRPLPTPVGMTALGDASVVQRAKGHIYFVNQVDVPDSIFVVHGLRPIPRGVQPNISEGDVIVRFSFEDRDGSSSWFMHLGYVYGNFGGQGYEIRIYKSPGLRRFVYVPTWIS